MKKILWLWVFVVLFTACTKPQPTIKVNEQNLKLVTINYRFPILDPLKFIAKNDTLGLVCNDCPNWDDTLNRIFIASWVFIEKPDAISFRGFMTGPPGDTYTYDSVGRIKHQEVTSCYNWNIDYTYKDSLDNLMQITKLDEKYGNKPDTTIYKLDSLGRVKSVRGILYGDLYTRNYTKKMEYTGSSIIPDSIMSSYHRKNTNGIDIMVEQSKEVFYYHKDIVDSILFDQTEYYYEPKKFTTVVIFTGYFSPDGDLVKQKINKHIVDVRKIKKEEL